MDGAIIMFDARIFNGHWVKTGKERRKKDPLSELVAYNKSNAQDLNSSMHKIFQDLA